MNLNTIHTSIQFSERGTMTSFRTNDTEMLAEKADERPLFTIRMRDDQGCPIDIDSFSFQKISSEYTDEKITFYFSQQEQCNITVTATINVHPQEDQIEFWIEIHNDTDYYV